MSAPSRLTRASRGVSTEAMPLDVHTLVQEVDLNAPPQAVYDALMDEAQHAAFTGYEAQIDWREGGRFVTCGERHRGHTLVLVPGRKIVQAWGHTDFPEYHYSVVTIDLEPRGQGTKLVFTQIGVPRDAIRWLDESWRATYWEPLKRFLAEAESAA